MTSRLSDDRGFAVVVAVVVLLVGLVLTTALVAQSVSTQSFVRRDGASKRALAAAQAGANAGALLFTSYARTVDGPDTGKRCLTKSGAAIGFTSIDAATGWCPPITQQFGANESASYVVSAPPPDASGATTRQIVATGTIPNGRAGSVTRRVQQTIVSSGASYNVFDDYGLVALDPLSLSGTVTLGDVDIGGSAAPVNIRSNGSITLSGTVNICGNVTAGPGQPIYSSGDVSLCPGSDQQTATDTLSLDDPVAPTADEDAAIATACGSGACQWTNRQLTISGNQNISITANTLVLCSLTLSGQTNLTFVPRDVTQPVRIYIDSAAHCTAAGSGRTINMSGGTSLQVSSASPYPLQLYVSGSASVNLVGTGDTAWTVYAPSSTVNVSGGPTIYGGIAAKSVSFSGNAYMHVSKHGTGDLSYGGPSTYSRGTFTECTAQPITPTPDSGITPTPDSGC